MKKITLTLLSAVAMLTAYGQSADTTIVLNYGEMVPIDTITISKSSATFKPAVKKHELPWKLVLDTDGENSVASRYGIVAAPTYVLIDPEGKVVNWNLGEHQTIEEYFE